VLINDILDFSKIEAGKLQLEKMDFEPVSECEEAINLVAERAESKGITLVFDPDPALPRMVVGDSGRLRQILINLLSNAVKFTDRGSVIVRLSATAEVDGWGLDLAVEDTGIGIKPEVLSRLFAPFAQADVSTTRRFGGTGLGLVISRRLAGAMGGTVMATSTPGVGSVFHCRIRVGISQREPNNQIIPGVNEQVVLVAAAPLITQVLVRRLASWGAVPVIARDAVEARERYAAMLADGRTIVAAIIDRDLPGTGLSLAWAIGGRCPCLFLAPLADTAFAEEVRVFGSVVVRPVRVAAFAYGLAAALGQTVAIAQRATQVLPRLTGRILVVEDNPVNQRVLLALLARLGLTAQAVGNGFEAVEASQKIPFDLILMDCQMPEMDGYEATATIRSLEAAGGRRIPILALTADVIEGSRERCLEAGMDDYLSKPVRQAELTQALVRWLPSGQDVAMAQASEAKAPESKPAVDCDISVIERLVSELAEEAREILTEIRSRLRDECEDLMSANEAALTTGDLAEVGRQAHRLRGQSLLLGMVVLSDLATELELHARSGNKSRVVELSGQLRPAVDRAMTALDRAMKLVLDSNG